MEASALASGSSGNCFYVSNGDNSVLVDAGISCRQIELRMAKIGRNIEDIDAVFVTHEHGDHISGVDVLARKYKLPIYATKGTINQKLCKRKELIKPIKNDESIKIGKMEIQAFPKSHDASDPVGFSLFNHKRVSVITDIGYCCQNVKDFVSDSDMLFLESNHNLGMLEDGPYPIYLKRRIKGEKGHLSNKDSALCVLEHGGSELKEVILSHLSKNNNGPKKALNSFGILKERKDLNPKITISGRADPTRLAKI